MNGYIILLFASFPETYGIFALTKRGYVERLIPKEILLKLFLDHSRI